TFTAVWQQNQPPAPTPTPTPTPTPSIPKTGDETFSATSALALVAISVICLTLSVLIFKRRKS
ncbi:MAG: LPXTG cell wall anchor domain-containing protein, partial [Coriobacteriales bacterium]|nr:LPXTG cell wall anchor domain-containing protein [Coriobacteriales bacterium]